VDRKWLPLNALRAFEAAGKHLSFTAAANSLTVAQSAVSCHVIVLKNFLGVPLFERRPQQLVLTEAGQHLLPVVSKSFDRIDQALSDIIKEGRSPRRALKVSLPATFAHQLAVPILKDFRAEHPGVTLDIESDMGHGLDNEADVAVVFTEPSVSDTVLDLLWMERLSILCHPSVAAKADPSDPASFIETNDLLHMKLDNRSRHHQWDLFARGIGRPDLDVDRGLVFDTSRLVVQYALSGEGLALVDPMLFKAEIDAGQLVSPFDVVVDGGYGYYLSTHPEDLNDEAVALFRSWLINRFAAHLADGPTSRLKGPVEGVTAKAGSPFRV
jgi:DNA-binding transcriptional LysR family regulator